MQSHIKVGLKTSGGDFVIRLHELVCITDVFDSLTSILFETLPNVQVEQLCRKEACSMGSLDRISKDLLVLCVWNQFIEPNPHRSCVVGLSASMEQQVLCPTVCKSEHVTFLGVGGY